MKHYIRAELRCYEVLKNDDLRCFGDILALDSSHARTILTQSSRSFGNQVAAQEVGSYFITV